MLQSLLPSSASTTNIPWAQRIAVVFLALLVGIGLAVAPTVAQAQDAQVQLIHNSGDPDARFVDVYIENDDGTLVQTLDNVKYRSATDFLAVPQDTYDVTVADSSSTGPDNSVIKEFTGITLNSGTNYTVVANGVASPGDFEDNPDGNDIAFDLDIATGALPSGTSGDNTVEIRAAHGATDAPTVDVQDANDNLLFDDASYGGITSYIDATAESITLKVTPGDDNDNTAVATFTDVPLGNFEGNTLTVVASGFLSPGNENTDDDRPVAPFTLLAVDNEGNVVDLGAAQAQVVHNAGDPDAKRVDIYVDEERVLDDFAYRSASSFVGLGSGVRDISVAPASSEDTTDAVATFTRAVPANGSLSILANGVLSPGDFQNNPDGIDTAFDLDIATGARESVSSTDGDVEIRAVHGATDAPTVDVLAGGNVFVDDASYTDITGYQGAPAQQLTLEVTPGNDNNTVLYSFDADLSEFADTPLTVVASGFNTIGDENTDDDRPVAPFTLLAVAPDGSVIDLGTAQAQIIHNSGDPAARVVDIYVDGERVLDDFSYRSASSFIDLDSGVRQIAVAPPSSDDTTDAVAQFSEAVPANASLSILANGVITTGNFTANPDGEDIAFDLDIATGARASASTTDGDVEVRAAHGVTDAPTVDVLAGGNVFVDDASYTDITGYQGAPAQQLTLEVTPGNDNNTILYSFDADLSGFADTPLTVLASGFNTPGDESASPLAPFTLLAVAPDGTVLDLGAAKAQIVHNSGDPDARTVDVYVDGTRILNNFEYRSATSFVDLASGVRDISVAPASSEDTTDAVATFTEVVPTNGSLTILANGVLTPDNFQDNPSGSDIAFDLDIATGARESVSSADGDVEVRAAHGATDAPTVDVLAGGSVFVDDATYPAITDYQGAPAQRLTLEVTPGNDNSTALYTYAVDLGPFADTPLTVLASGFNTTDDESSGQIPPFTLLAVAPDGTVLNLGSDVYINEFLADPDGSVDANNDGTADGGDQFVELVNVSTTDTLDLSGYAISTSNGSYTLPSASGTTLDPGKGLVVFNGGSPTGFGVFAGTGLPAINNSGDEIVLANASNDTLQTVQFGGGSNSASSPKATVETDVPQQAGEATAREVNGSGDLVLHTNIASNPVVESAGENNETGATLPVELADFSASLDGSGVVLTWRTLSEQNNSGFAVQHRPPEASSFEKAGFREGQGTTTEATSYRFRVPDLDPGTHAFRLRQVDLDGSTSLSDRVTVEVTLDEAFTWSKVAPNPVSGTGTLSIRVRETQDVTVELFDVLGRRVRALHSGTLEAGSSHQMTVDGSRLSTGAYLLRVTGEDFSDTQRITVVR